MTPCSARCALIARGLCSALRGPDQLYIEFPSSRALRKRFLCLIRGTRAAPMDYAEMGLRLGLSILLGGLIGFEREAAHKPAGLRTNILVCLGTTLFILAALRTLEISPESPAAIARVAAGIITGIGFLGAGAILRTGEHVQGLTTAATIWFVCGIGVATGLGHYLLAVVSAVVGFVVLRFLPLLEEKGR